MVKYCTFCVGNTLKNASYFSPAKQTVKIGRLNSCEIQIEDSLMSKYQAEIQFTDKGWILSDGANGKSSTNGTWYQTVIKKVIQKIGCI